MRTIGYEELKKLTQKEPIEGGLVEKSIGINFSKEEYEWLLFNDDGSISTILTPTQREDLSQEINGGNRSEEPIIVSSNNDLAKLEKYLNGATKDIEDFLYKPVEDLDNLLKKINIKKKDVYFTLIEDLVNKHPNSRLLKALINKMCLNNNTNNLYKLYKLLLNKYMGQNYDEIYKYVLLNSQCGLTVNNNTNEFIKLYTEILISKFEKGIIKQVNYRDYANPLYLVLRNIQPFKNELDELNPNLVLSETVDLNNLLKNDTVFKLRQLLVILKEKDFKASNCKKNQYNTLNDILKNRYKQFKE